MTQPSLHIAIIGGNGFIGDAAVSGALAAGHRVTSVGRSMLPAKAWGKGFDYVPGGLAAFIADPVHLKGVDAVWHLASTTVPAQANADPRGDAQDNLLPLIALLETLRQHGPARVLYLSSGGAIYGTPRHLPIPEDHPLQPASAYGATKVAAETYLMLYQRLYGLNPVIIRPSNPYGPGQRKLGVLGAVTTFVNAALTGQPVSLWGDGSAVRDFVHVSDLVDLMLATLHSPASGAFNCGSGTGTSLSELLCLVEEATGRQVARKLLPARPFDPPKVVLDIARAHETFGWAPRIALTDGLVDVAAAHRGG